MSGENAAAAAAEEEVQVSDALNMSDEDVLKMGEAFLAPPADEGDDADDPADSPSAADDAGGDDPAPAGSDKDDDDADDGAGDDDNDDDPAADDSADGDEDGSDGDDDPADPASGDADDDSADPDPEAKNAGDDPGKTDGDAPDYKAFHDQLTAPFRANNREMKVDNADDAIRLMQMGANYNQKMGALKPNLKLMKMLDKNGLLDEDKLSYLIDLDKKNPAAIAKLLKDSDIDAAAGDLDEAGEYKASKYTVHDREVDLDNALESIKDSEHYTQTLDVVSNKWDAKSKQIVADSPQLLEVINGHMASGHYDLIDNEMVRQRTLGNLQGMSDIEAYRAVGDKLHADGKFAQLDNTPAAKETPAPKAPPAKPAADNPNRKAKRKAAAATKSKVPAAKKEDFNPLGMSDEDFAKEHDPHLLTM